MNDCQICAGTSRAVTGERPWTGVLPEGLGRLEGLFS
jgi:hypothetical protein